MRSMAGLLLMVLAGCDGPEPVPVTDQPAVSSPTMAAVPVTVEAAPVGPAPVPPQAAADAALAMDVMQVVGRSEDAVSELLGTPDSCDAIHRARLCRYPPDGNEVMFVAGKADMITVHNMGAVAFDEHALRALGLVPAGPDDASERAIRWQSIPDLEEVTVFAGEGGYVRYAYIKVGKH